MNGLFIWVKYNFEKSIDFEWIIQVTYKAYKLADEKK